MSGKQNKDDPQELRRQLILIREELVRRYSGRIDAINEILKTLNPSRSMNKNGNTKSQKRKSRSNRID